MTRTRTTIRIPIPPNPNRRLRLSGAEAFTAAEAALARGARDNVRATLLPISEHRIAARRCSSRRRLMIYQLTRTRSGTHERDLYRACLGIEQK
jgi:hypothetical protein